MYSAPGHTGHERWNPCFLLSSQDILLANDSLSWVPTDQSSWQRIKVSPRLPVPRWKFQETHKRASKFFYSSEPKLYFGWGVWNDDFRPDHQAEKREGRRSLYSGELDLLVFWKTVLLIFISARLCPKPEGVCLIHHAPWPHNGTPDKQNIGEWEKWTSWILMNCKCFFLKGWSLAWDHLLDVTGPGSSG